MPQFFSPVGNDQTFDANGDPLTGGQIETYVANSTTPAATFTSGTGIVAQSNPIYLDSLGYPPSPIWLAGGVAYKFVIKNALGVTLKTIDGISGINDSTVSVSEWVSSGFVPTYISATSFSVPGDQRTILQVGRRLRTTNTAGIVYSGISASSFGSGVTTVTVINDSGTLDSGLSLVEYGLISATNTSFPFATFSAASTIALTNDGTTNAAHYLTFADGTAGQENLKTDTAKLGYNPSTGALTAASFVGSGSGLTASSVPFASLAEKYSVGTAIASTSGSTVEFTGLPSWVRRITLSFVGLSTTGGSVPVVQLGTSSGFVTTGYLSSSANIPNAANPQVANNTAGIGLSGAHIATVVMHGAVTFTKVTANTWIGLVNGGRSDAGASFSGGGSIALAAVMDRIRLLTTDTFDAGSVNISWE